MQIYHEIIEFNSNHDITIADITDKAEEIFESKDVSQGLMVVYTQHTTCSVQIQELSDGTTEDGTELIMQDLIEVFDRIIPIITRLGQYHHPNQNHLDIAFKERGEKNEWCMNTDGHLRSIIMGRSVSIPIIDKQLVLGEFGRIFFADWDSTRERKRYIYVTIISE